MDMAAWHRIKNNVVPIPRSNDAEFRTAEAESDAAIAETTERLRVKFGDI